MLYPKDFFNAVVRLLVAVPLVLSCSDSTVDEKVDAEDVLWALGSGNSGALGFGDELYYSRPIQLLGVNGILQLEASNNSSLALTQSGNVLAWGDNSYGQLGIGEALKELRPVQILPGTKMSSITLSNSLGGATDENGYVWLWGSLQTFSPNLFSFRTPIRFENYLLPRFIDVKCGSSFCMMLSEEGEVWAIGNNDFGQLASPTTQGRIQIEKIEGISGVSAIAAGSHHALALVGGEVYAWGANNYGQCGLVSCVNCFVPKKVEGLNNIKAVAAGFSHSLVLTSVGRVMSFGYGGFGELGTNILGQKQVPKVIESLTNVSIIYAKDNVSLALAQGGDFFAWGKFDYNSNPFQGNINRYTPTRIECLDDASAIAASGFHYLIAKDYNLNFKGNCF
ncbi:MAG TPA: hypothetical protein PKJ63_05990 [Cyclobacteriaceae bacterium]|nr:hypothetical protein [Cyclobacteriaceae bacterium]